MEAMEWDGLIFDSRELFSLFFFFIQVTASMQVWDYRTAEMWTVEIPEILLRERCVYFMRLR